MTRTSEGMGKFVHRTMAETETGRVLRHGLSTETFASTFFPRTGRPYDLRTRHSRALRRRQTEAIRPLE